MAIHWWELEEDGGRTHHFGMYNMTTERAVYLLCAQLFYELKRAIR